MTRSQAARLGGRAVVRKYGVKHMRALSKKAQHKPDPWTLAEILGTREGRKVARSLEREFGTSGLSLPQKAQQ